jgi:hypothetical protein
LSQPKLNLEELQSLDRHYDCPLDHPIIEDLLWSDPEVIDGFLPNVRRNAGVLFGYDSCVKFCETFGVDFIVRSHEAKEQGFANELNGKCFTIFSASNYCQSGNKGAFINFDKSQEFAPSRVVAEADLLNQDLPPYMRVVVFESSAAADCSVSLRRVALIEGSNCCMTVLFAQSRLIYLSFFHQT